MSTQHTPGPWIAGYGATHEIGQIFGVGINTEPDWTPVCVVSPADSTNDIDRANACLIAAAPDLLEALQSFVVAADRVSAEPATWLGKARAAIAKATGGEV